MNTYEIKLTGSVEKISVFLSDLLEKQITPMNKNYDMKIDDMFWETDVNGGSIAGGKFSFGKAFRNKDLKDIHNEYKINMTMRKVNDEAVATS